MKYQFLIKLKSVLSIFFSLLFKNSLSETSFLRKGDNRLASRSDSHNVRDSGGEGVSLLVFNGDQIVVSSELGDVLDNSDSSSIVSVHNINNVVNLHLEVLSNGIVFEVQFDSVVHLNSRVDISEGSSVVGHKVTNLVRSDRFLLNSAELELSFFLFKLDKDESSLDVVENSVGSSEFWDVDYVHKS